MRVLLAVIGGMICGLASVASAAADVPAAVLFADDFGRDALGDRWDVHPNSYRIVDGVLIGGQRPDADHGAVSQVFVDFQDAELSFDFRLAGSPGFNVVIDDRKYKGSHAGHICRVRVTPKAVILQDDKTGAMRNDLFARRRDPAQRKAAEQELIGKSKLVAVDLTDGEWHALTVRIEGETMSVQLDGKPLGTLTSAGIGHATKTDFGFTVIGRELHLDNVRLHKPGK